MCKQGSITLVKVIGGPHTEVGVDTCIAPIITALNAVGVSTIASCCGHNKRPGNIALRDGRELIIARNFEEARLIDSYCNKKNADV